MNQCNQSGMMPLADALSTMLEQVTSVQETERLTLRQAHQRVAAQDIHSPMNVPPADNSAMDGYALHSDSERTQYTLVGKALAGAPYAKKIEAGQCIRIMTGGVIPEGANAVVMQENVSIEGECIKLEYPADPGQCVRKVGEDIERGKVIIEKGKRLTPADLSLLASVGIPDVSTFRRPNVAILATGDELTPPGQALQLGAIYESNRYAIYALLQNAHVDILDLGIVPDDKEALTQAFEQAQESCDLVISSGGVSVGDADYVKEVLAKIGQVGFWKVAIKPGKPFAFGKIGQAWFTGLPGNPVSSYVTFEQLVVPILQTLSGENIKPKTTLIATAQNTIRKRPGRLDFQRGVYQIDESGQLNVVIKGQQSSGIMSSIAQANCYVVLERERGNIVKGELVNIQPF